MQLGWESDCAPSEALLAKTLSNYRAYSGEYGFSDETDGDGRFDRYSVLLAGELTERCIETGRAVPPEVKQWLRKSVDVMLPRLNLRGEGFEYGRSIGAYGETTFLEVFTVAAAMGVLSEQEKAMAYAFSARIAARHADFWLGSHMYWNRAALRGRISTSRRGRSRSIESSWSSARSPVARRRMDERSTSRTVTFTSFR